MEVDNAVAVHFCDSEKIIEECFLILWISDITGVHGDLTCSLEQANCVLWQISSLGILEHLDKLDSVLLKQSLR